MPRQRTATELLHARGSFKESRQPQETAIPGSPTDYLEDCPPAPDVLSETAKRQWYRLGPIVIEMGTLTRADLKSFELLCNALAMEEEALAVLAKSGMFLEASHGLKPHPAIKVAESSRAQAIRLLEHFGLTAKARQYVSIRKPKAPNPFDGL